MQPKIAGIGNFKHRKPYIDGSCTRPVTTPT